MRNLFLPCVLLLSLIFPFTQGHSATAAKHARAQSPATASFWSGAAPFVPQSFYHPSSADNWVGGTGNWSNPAYWSSGLPGGSSDVLINTGNDYVTLDTSANINSLTLGGSNGSSTLIDPVGNGYTLSISAAMTINHSGTLDLTFDNVIANGNSSNAGRIFVGLFSQLQVNADLTNSGAIGLNGIYGVGPATLNVSGNLSNSGTITDEGTLSGTLTVGGNLTNSGQLSVAQIGVQGALTNSATGYLEIDAGGGAGSLSNAGTIAVYEGGLFVTGDATNSGQLTISNDDFAEGGDTLSVGGTLTNNAAGTITVSGYPGALVSAANLINAGSIQLEGWASLSVNGNVTNSGTIATSNPNANQITVGGRFTNNAGGVLQLMGTRDTATIASLNNMGAITVGNSATLSVPVGSHAGANAFAGFVNSGTVLVQQGGAISSYANYTQVAGQTTVDGHLGGIINLAGGSLYGNGGTVSGSITSNASINMGDAPLTVGQMTFVGNYTQRANGSLTFDIAGANSYDQLNISGQAHLNGLMTIDLLHGYIPQVGNLFPIMTFAGESGTFSSVVGLPIDNQEHFVLQYNATNLTLDVVSGPLAGVTAITNGSKNSEPFIPTAENGNYQMDSSLGASGTTPEPGSILLFGSGIAGVAGMLRGKKIL